MWNIIKGLLPGIILIAATSSILLLSDTQRNRNHNRSTDSQKTIAIFYYSSRGAVEDCRDGVLQGLAQRGWMEGKNLKVVQYNAENDMPTASTIATTILNQPYDLVVTLTTPCLQTFAAVNKHGGKTHIFGMVTDPYGSGVGIRSEQPGDHPAHLAGAGTFQPVEKTFELAKRANPNLQKVGTVWNPAEACSEACTIKARAICKELGIELLEATIENSAGVLEACNSLAARGAQALYFGGDNTVIVAAGSVLKAASQAKIPVISNSPEFAPQGAMLNMGADYIDVGIIVGAMAGDVLSGHLDPADVAIRDMVPDYISVNLQVAKGMPDWSLPEDIVERAKLLVMEDGTAVDRLAERATGPTTPVAAAGKNYRFGIVYFGPDPGVEISIQGLKDGMADLGYITGKNTEYLQQHANGEVALLPQILSGMDNSAMDMIFAFTTPCLAAAIANARQTPVVFTTVFDPIAAGAGTSFADHAAHLTGIGSFPPVDETFNRIREAVPSLRRLGTLYNASEANSVSVIKRMREITARHGVELVETTVSASAEIYQGAQALVAQQTDALWVTGDNTVVQGIAGVANACRDAKIPLVLNDEPFVHEGALFSVGLGFYKPAYAAAALASRILHGTAPKDIPFQNISEVQVCVNFRVARRLQHTFSPQLLANLTNVVALPDRFEPARPARIHAALPDELLGAVTTALASVGLTRDRDWTAAVASDPQPDLVLCSQDQHAALAKQFPDIPVFPLTAATGENPTAIASRYAVPILRILCGVSPDQALVSAAVPTKTTTSRPRQKWNIHYLSYIEAPTTEATYKGLIAGLNDAGLLEGVDYTLKSVCAQGDIPSLQTMVELALAADPDMIVLSSTPTLQAAVRKVRDIPVIFGCVGDPIAAGAGTSNEDHLPNFAGVLTMSPFEEMVQIVRTSLPGARSIGTLYVPSEINSECFRQALETAAEAAGLKLIAKASSTASEVPQSAMALVSSGVDVICQISDNLHGSAFATIAQAAQRAQIPLFSFVSTMAETEGAALALARDYEQGGRDMAALVQRVMQGESPAQMHFQPISKTELTINIFNAAHYNLKFPQSLLEQANRVLQ